MDSCRLWKKTRRYGLIGYPIAHSGSPALFRQAYGGKWSYDLIENPSFEEAWRVFLDGYDAINITAPFKEKAAAEADIQSPEVQSIGAANIAVKTRCGIKVFNSDYLGVRMLLEELGAASGTGVQSAVVEPLRVAVVGYGGAGKAAVAAAKDMGLEVEVFNRSDHGLAFVRPLAELPQASADLLIYSLPMLVPEMGVWMERVRKGEVPCPRYCIEANYRDPVLKPYSQSQSSTSPESDSRASLLPAAVSYIPGERWLMAQAVTGYELLTGEKPRF